jgi:hypothetical protein
MQQKGPHNSLVVFQLQTLIQKFTEIWSGSEKFDNEINRDLIKQEIFPKIENEIKERVDQIMKRELDNYYFQLNITRRKEKRAKKKRRGKNKNKKIPGEKLVIAKNPVDLVSEVIETNILKKNKTIRFQDFIGTENIIR